MSAAPSAATTLSSRAIVMKPRALAALVAVTLVGVGAFCWPLVISFGAADAGHAQDAPWIFLVLLPLLLLVVAAEIADGGMDAKAVALLGVLGNVAMFASAALTGGGGPWLPFQMLAAGWIGMFAGVLPRARGRVELIMLAGYGFAASICYGFVLNLWFWPFAAGDVGTGAAVAFDPGAPLGENLRRWLAFSVTTSLGFDIPRGVATAVALLLLGHPVLLALRRAARRAAFTAPAQFTR